MWDVSGCFEEGDDFTFFPEHFEDSGDANFSGDANLELIDKTIKKIQTTLSSIQNLNGIEGSMKWLGIIEYRIIR